MNKDEDSFFLLGLAIVAMVAIVAAAVLGLIDMDDSKTNQLPTPAPVTQEVTP